MRKTLPLMAFISVLALASCSKNTTQPQVNAQADSQAQTGNEVSSQIVNGSISARGARPYQVALTSRGRQFCGGTLIDPNWVLTAAHCMGSGSISVRVGVNRLSSNQGETISVSRVYTHPRYRDVGFGYDIALLKLSRAARLSSYVKPAALPSNRVENILDVSGKYAVVSGWGDLRSGAGRGSDDLREVRIPIEPDPSVCGGNSTPLPNNIICGTYYGGKDSCQGDSGGPLAEKYSGKFYVLGVVSYGVGCSGGGVYTRVNGYLDWIKQVSGVSADGNGGSPSRPPVDNNPPTRPPSGSITYSGTINRGDYGYAPEAGFTLSTSTTLKGELTADDSADFDLYLEKKGTYGWRQVARSMAYNTSHEIISYSASAGTYRWKIKAWSGTSEATLVQTPRGNDQRSATSRMK